MGQICETCRKRSESCCCAPNSTCGDYESIDSEGYYNVSFVQNHTYTVKANDEEEAIDIAEKLFREDMLRPVAKTWYDEVEVNSVEK